MSDRPFKSERHHALNSTFPKEDRRWMEPSRNRIPRRRDPVMRWLILGFVLCSIALWVGIALPIEKWIVGGAK